MSKKPAAPPTPVEYKGFRILPIKLETAVEREEKKYRLEYYVMKGIERLILRHMYLKSEAKKAVDEYLKDEAKRKEADKVHAVAMGSRATSREIEREGKRRWNPTSNSFEYLGEGGGVLTRKVVLPPPPLNVKQAVV